MKTTLYTRVFNLLLLCLLLSVGARAQFGSDLGTRSISSLAWQQFASHYATNNSAGTIGLTTDGRVYTWGGNSGYTIHTQKDVAGQPKYQTVPYYVPFPAGEVVKKVGIKSNFLLSSYFMTYFSLSESGKLYAWGVNSGLLPSAWPVMSSYTNGDTTKTVRTPVQLTILGETSFVDFDASVDNKIWVAIGASGNAYHIGEVSFNAPATTSFSTMPKPSGVDVATFKYTNVWVEHSANSAPQLFLKGNNGKIYYSGTHYNALNSGVPTLVGIIPTIPSPESEGNVTTLAPVEVSFPVGEDIVSMKVSQIDQIKNSTYAISSSGKAYLAGAWKRRVFDAPTRVIIAPLATVPANADILKTLDGGDTLFTLKRFTQIAVPPGAAKILDIAFEPMISGAMNNGTLVVADNNKAFWSGNTYNPNNITYITGNYLSLSNSPGYVDQCFEIKQARADSQTAWTSEALNFEGAKKLFGTWLNGGSGMFVISGTNRGYYAGTIASFSGLGKMGDRYFTTPFPEPIANEQLLDCQTSPGTGGPLGNPVTTPGVVTIDCSKTKLYPAPVAGVPSQVSLIVTVNVTTIGDFTPITVSGSGMSLPSDFSSVSATTTGVQQFHIPLNYDGTALTNAFQFTIGSAGSCTADLTQKPNKQVTNVWSLTNCSTVTPGVLSK